MREFGRTPPFAQYTGNGANETGRDHWSQCYSLFIANGPQPGGRIIGRSHRFAASPAHGPITPPDLAASLLHAFGVDPGMQVRDDFTRNVPLSTGRVKPAFLGG
jgi:hypothetical protein